MSDFAIKIGAMVEKAGRAAQAENRRRGIANAYCLNGTLVWQLPDGTIVTTDPNV